jgi:spore photoproduct lyase
MKRRAKPSPGRDLCERRTRFVDIFRTTPTNTVCPNFFVLQHANGCTFDPLCSYCYLKSSFWYLERPRAFSNTDKLLADVRTWIARDNLESYVLNMGNLSDSLGFEEDRRLVPDLVELFREAAEAKGRPHLLLLVTKGGTKECAPLLNVAACRNVRVSFSVNAVEAARDHERGAAPVDDRLAAARQLQEQGWLVRMRIDPMISRYGYGWIIGEVCRLRPERVTLGTLRAEPHLLKKIRNGLFRDLEPSTDPKGLARYPLAVRLGLYRPAVEALRDICPVGLCEETPDVWAALGLDADAKPCNCGV